MKIKGCTTFLGLLIVVFFGISFFMPSNMNTLVKRDLGATPEQIYAQINDVSNWTNWSPWFKMDPEIEVTYGETTIGKGASYAWNSEKKSMGVGAMIIDESIENEKIGTILKFEGKEDGFADLMISGNKNGGSSVIWDFESGYTATMPWDRLKMTFNRMMLKSSYNKGLTSLDDYIKANPEAHLEYQSKSGTLAGLKIKKTTAKNFNAVTVVVNGAISDMMENGHELYANAYEEVMNKIEAKGLEMDGSPIAFANLWDEEAGLYELEIGIPVISGGKQYEGGQALRVDFHGSYEGIKAAHDALHKYMQTNALKMVSAPWEVYVTDPETEPDTSKWLTKVYYRVTADE